MGVIQSELLCDIWLARVGGRDASLRTAVNFSNWFRGLNRFDFERAPIL